MLVPYISMNQDYKFFDSSLARILISLCLAVFLYCCTTYNFSQPQPVDRKNIYTFPKKFRGVWGSEITPKDSANAELEKGTYSFVLNKHYLRFTQTREENILLKNLKEIIYDSLQKKMDTITHYVLHEGYIYSVDASGLLDEPHAYHLENDTITIFENDTIYVDLGKNAFLRKLNKNFYVLNMRNFLIDQGSMGWYLVILEKEHKGILAYLECGDKSTTLPSMFYAKHSENGGGSYYFNSKWTSVEMLQLIHQGYFDTSETLVKQKRIRK
jgi:hypothetical protein